MHKISTRASNIELLRIISIFCVVFSHFCVHSHFDFSTDALSLNQIMVQLGRIGEIGVSIFIIITGYYTVKKSSSFQKIILIMMEVWSYNVIILLLAMLNKTQIGAGTVIKNLLPIYNTHWFVYTYIFLCLLAPFINRLLVSMDKACYRKIMSMLLLCWSVIYTFTGADLNFSYLVWFVFLYMLGAYINLHGNEKPNVLYNGCFLLVCIILLIVSTVVIDVVGLKVGFYPGHGDHFYSLQSPLVLGIAFSMFQLFRGIEIKRNKYINAIAGTTLAVYLISDNAIIRSWLWNDLFKNPMHSNNPFLMLIGIVEVLAVCCVCSGIDMGRKKIFSTKCMVQLTKKISSSCEQAFQMIMVIGWRWLQKLM